LGDITRPERTVLFFERGLPGEQRVMKNQSIDNYDGSCKGSAKSFVGRHNGKGVITFVDGHVGEFHMNEILNETGNVPPLKESPVRWTLTPEENSNTVGSWARERPRAASTSV
jgi:prepilin-type processing-associated H-X9-DG protein